MISLQILMLSPLKMSLAFEIIRYATMVYLSVEFYWRWIHRFFLTDTEQPSRKYFLSDDDEYDESYARVPEGAVYIEEWINNDGDKLCYVQYEGEEIVQHKNPFHHKKAKCPWLAITDEETDIELTRTFNRFLIPGNKILLDIVEKLIHITDNTRLMYIDSATLEVKKFPGNGILIEEDE